MRQARIFRVEGQGDEGLEAARFVLEFAQPDQMVDAVIWFFEVAVQHRTVGAQSQLVCRAVDLQPVSRVGFVFTNFVTDFRMKYLCPPTGHAPQAGLDHVGQNLAIRAAGQVGEPVDFHRRPGLEMQGGKRLMQEVNQMQIPVILFLVVQPSHDVHFGATCGDRLLAAGENLLIAHQIPFRVAEVRAKCAKRASVDADIGGIEMRVDVVISDVAVFAVADQIGQFCQFPQRHFRLVEVQSVLQRQPLVVKHFVAYLLEARGFCRQHASLRRKGCGKNRGATSGRVGTAA